jgi:hypothetical protein
MYQHCPVIDYCEHSYEKNGVFWDVTAVALVRTDISEELSTSIIRVTTIGELGRTLAVSSNRPNTEEWCLLGCYALWLL